MMTMCGFGGGWGALAHARAWAAPRNGPPPAAVPRLARRAQEGRDMQLQHGLLAGLAAEPAVRAIYIVAVK